MQASSVGGGVGPGGAVHARGGRGGGRAAPAAVVLSVLRDLHARAGTLGRCARSGVIWNLGVWRLEVQCRRRRLVFPEHGTRTEGVPFACEGLEFTRDFECLVAWLAARTDNSTICRMVQIDWDTVGRIIRRGVRRGARSRPARGSLRPRDRRGLLERQHHYLTLVVDHQRGQVVWGTEGAGAAAADAFFRELDPEQAQLCDFAKDVQQERSPDARRRALPAPRRAPARDLAGHGPRVRQVRARARPPGGHLHRPLPRLQSVGGEVWRGYTLKA